jgi:uncharacterized protein
MAKTASKVEVRESAIHGRGCFATERISAKVRVLEYTGRRISEREANERYWNRPNLYLFGLRDGTIIDGLGIAALVNHSCSPNCKAEEEDGRLWYRTVRAIEKDEELTIDYKMGHSGEREMPCHCGSPKCRGSMYSKKELRIRKKRGINDGERSKVKS